MSDLVNITVRAQHPVTFALLASSVYNTASRPREVVASAGRKSKLPALASDRGIEAMRATRWDYTREKATVAGDRSTQGGVYIYTAVLPIRGN